MSVVKTSPFLMLTWSSLKAYFRNRGAIFFSLLVPLMIMGIFGLINFGNSTPSVNIGVVDQAHNQVSNTILANLRGIKAVKLHTGDLAAEKHALTQGNRDLVAVLPASIGQGSTAITAYYNQGNPQNSQVAIAIMNQFVDRASFAVAGLSPAFTLDTQPVQSRNLTYVDFLVPGMIALSIMQTGLFGVVFTFVQWKQRGILRRLMATPMRVRDFFFSQLVTRLATVALQIAVLLAVGLLLFHFHFTGNLFYLLLVGILGGGIFLAMGLAISGASKSEETAAPLANLISLPLMFLSGIFFSRSNMPDWLQTITQYSPLTYVSDALRSISIDGASLWAVRTDLLGIFVWLAVAVVLATRLFKWEVV
ncbi:MAG TPA: ABC transporter permease [Candidatus Dormibacteraeota bacterium]|jgi:ABC-2 type transport system permease protein